jgi:hypothetical protein
VEGFRLVEGVVSPKRVAALRKVFGGQGRGALRVELIRELAHELGERPVRGIFFDKVPEANWKVPWHQDITIAVKARIDVPGFKGWSVKDGIPHVQPPVEILQQMTTVRISLDDCTPENGPLRVIPGSHLLGRLPKSEVLRRGHEGPSVECCVRAGGAVWMKPLLIHSSSKARLPSHRRVLHLEFAGCDLPGGLEWACD